MCQRRAGLSGPAAAGGPLKVVAAENFWGSIAAQLGGTKVEVQSIIVNPDTDPHSYEPTAQDARTMAGAKLAIVNGVGYDNWAPQAPAAEPVERAGRARRRRPARSEGGRQPAPVVLPGRRRSGDRARSSPTTTRLDPADAGYFAAQRQALRNEGLARYDELRAQIRARYAGVPVGYSESIFQGARRRASA